MGGGRRSSSSVHPQASRGPPAALSGVPGLGHLHSFPSSSRSWQPDPLISHAHSFLFSPKVVILTPAGKTNRCWGVGTREPWADGVREADPRAQQGGLSRGCGLGAGWGWMSHMARPTGWALAPGEPERPGQGPCLHLPPLTASRFALSVRSLVLPELWPDLLCVAAAGSQARESVRARSF